MPYDFADKQDAESFMVKLIEQEPHTNRSRLATTGVHRRRMGESMNKDHIHVFVGCDMQGDACLYLKRGECDGEGEGYLTSQELEEIAQDLEQRLNVHPVEIPMESGAISPKGITVCLCSGEAAKALAELGPVGASIETSSNQTFICSLEGVKVEILPSLGRVIRSVMNFADGVGTWEEQMSLDIHSQDLHLITEGINTYDAVNIVIAIREAQKGAK